MQDESDADRVARAKKFNPYIEDIFGKSGAADCEALISIFEPQFREKSDDIEFVKSMLRRLRRAKCDESELLQKLLKSYMNWILPRKQRLTWQEGL